MIRATNWAEWVLKGLLVGIAGFAVTYLKDIGTETGFLSRQFVELKYEIKRLAENQSELNNTVTRNLEKLEKRIETLERKRR